MSGNTYKSLLGHVNEGRKVVMITVMYNIDCKNNCKFIFTEENLHEYNLTSNFDEIVYQKARYVLETGKVEYVKVSENKTYLIEPFFPEPHLIIFGGGHIAKPLAEFAAKAGFLVTVIDDRPSFSNSKRFPDAEKVICESFEKSFSLINLSESSYVTIVTRGHIHDMDCLRQVLKYNTAYTGMIGSKRRIKSVIEQLLSEGYSKDKLDKINAPIGLEIGAITPEEIAFSIISQVISYRRHVNTTNVNLKPLKSNWPEFDREVFMELSKKDDSPKAIVTIISTKGSVPRKTGAKMLVWPYGKVSGSIGGGCSEGDIINTARDVIRNGGYQIQSIDMTGYVAEEEGMVCGGIMNVVIEFFDKYK